MPVVLDSNIWVSAFHFRGKPHAIVNTMMEGELDVAVSEHIIGETTRILGAKFGWQEDDLDNVRQIMRTFARVVTPTETLAVVPGDADDNRIIECARAAGANTIVTGDNDLLRLVEFEGVRMIRAADFLGQSRGR